MSSAVALLERTLEDYKSDERPTWCPGCGDFGVLNAIYNALHRLALDPKNTVLVSGIGCSSRLPFFVSTYGFHGVHGRTMPVATGIKVSRPDLTVIVLGGDGDAFAIGAGHFVHAARRNLDITYIIMDNSIYGLTKGQTSPTSQRGFVTKTTPQGSLDQALNPPLLALASGATFVARGFSGRPKDLADLVVRGVGHKGFSLIDVFSPCPTFNRINTFKFYRESVADLPASHDVTDMAKALESAMTQQPLYLGVFYERMAGTFDAAIRGSAMGTEADRRTVLEELVRRFT